jgi:hypothetical protein
MAENSLELIRQRIVQGDHDQARSQLAEYLRAVPDDADGWALLACLLDDPAEQLECYRQVLRIDPASRQATAWVDSLTSQLRPAPDLEAPCDELTGITVGPGTDLLDAALDALDLPDLEEDVAPPLQESVSPAPPSAPSLSPMDVEPGWEFSLEDEAASGATPVTLTPDEILKLAGGPLPEGERRRCPACGATISRTQTKCAWCSSPLLG